MTTPVIINGATSPAPRLIAKITPVNIPGIALGKTIFLIICHFVEPRAKAPSLLALGTERMPSSVATTTTGNVNKASVSEAQRIPPVPKVGSGRDELKNS